MCSMSIEENILYCDFNYISYIFFLAGYMLKKKKRGIPQ